jgi:hypothetical protein
MSDGSPHDPAGMKREPQILGSDELIVYEAIATLRGPAETGDVIATTGLEEDTVRAALEHLTELELVVQSKSGTSIGPNDWDVRGAN